MEHLKQETTSGTQFNLDALYKICPSCFTEARDENTGELHRVVDFNKLRALLGDNAIEDQPETYDFTWVGKNAARREAAAPIRKTLRPCPEESEDWENTQNLYIEGDNLEVLKLLQNSYMGKIKMIYIDPPYNTGNDFVYHDDYKVSREEYEQEAGNLDEEGNRYRKNTETNGRFHSDWCSMIYARLMVARSLLTEDGIIFISIDDNELTNLKKICDEVFGEGNFVDIFNWAKTETPENLSKKSKQIIEYLLCYEKTQDPIKLRGIKKKSVSSNGLLNQPNSVKELTFPAGKINTSIPDGVICAGMYGTDKYDVELLEDTEVKNGLFIKDVVLRAKFKWSQTNLKQEIDRGTSIRIPKMTFSPSYEKLEYDAEVPSNLINNKVGVFTNESAGEYQLKLFSKKVFNYPKPISLIKYLLGFKDDGNEMIVLDFFSGSATTAEAVYEINSLDRAGNIRYILIQIQENLYESLKNTKTPSAKEIIKNAIDFCNEKNVPTNLCEIAKERIRRAGKKIKEDNRNKNGIKNLDTGFRVFKCDSSNMKDVYYTPATYNQDMLWEMLDNIKEDRTDLDLLFGCMLEWGVELSLPLSKETVDGCDIHIVNEGDLIACYSSNITENVVNAIAEKMPLRVVFRDSSFNEAAHKMNLFERFKQICEWSEEEVKKNIKVI